MNEVPWLSILLILLIVITIFVGPFVLECFWSAYKVPQEPPVYMSEDDFLKMESELGDD